MFQNYPLQVHSKDHLLLNQYLTEASEGIIRPELTCTFVKNTLGYLPILYVDATQIRFRLPKFKFAREEFIPLGHWPVGKPIESFRIWQEITSLLDAGRQYRTTPVYQTYLNALSKGQPLVRLGRIFRSKEHIDWYFDRYLFIAGDIARRGLFSHRTYEDPEGDIDVAIGPEGEIFYCGGGNHRSAIAYWLGLNCIPTQVSYVHPQWLKKVSLQAADTMLGSVLKAFNRPPAQAGGMDETLEVS